MRVFTSVLILGIATTLYAAGCDTDNGRSDSADVTESGSCQADDCGGKGSNGSCWCDENCADYGDCCLNAAEECSVNECLNDTDCGRDRSCSIGATCAAIGCPPPPPNNCIDEPPPPDGTCESDADCVLFSSYCGGCDCLALDVGSPPPLCPQPEHVACFVDPCVAKEAKCNAGTCEAVPAGESCGTCVSDNDCVAMGQGTECSTSNGDCQTHCGCLDGGACAAVCTGTCS